MVKLKYKSLVTKETIDYYLSIIKDEKQKKNIAKDFKAYFKTVDEYADFLEGLIKKYDIKPPSERKLVHLAFNLNTNTNDNTEYRQLRFKFIRADQEWQDLFS